MSPVVTLKPIDPEYLRVALSVQPSGRLHRLIARLFDTYIDDLPDGMIDEIEAKIDERRICHADGSRFGSKSHG
jgi:hypothetical protein